MLKYTYVKSFNYVNGGKKVAIKYKEISESIQRKIIDGLYNDTKKLPTEKDIEKIVKEGR